MADPVVLDDLVRGIKDFAASSKHDAEMLDAWLKLGLFVPLTREGVGVDGKPLRTLAILNVQSDDGSV